eukprot:scaffold15300_cov23-Cyclotella_meneghiniana.AAC.2
MTNQKIDGIEKLINNKVVVMTNQKIDGMEKLIMADDNSNNNIESSFLPKESSSLRASEITVDNNQGILLDTLSNLALFVIKSTVLLGSVFFIANRVDYVKIEKQIHWWVDQLVRFIRHSITFKRNMIMKQTHQLKFPLSAHTIICRALLIQSLHSGGVIGATQQEKIKRISGM